MNKKYQIFLGVVAIMILFTATYISSCTKAGKRPGCVLISCLNGGYCDTAYHGTDTAAAKKNNDTARCYCPTGYTGLYCQTAIISKYFGLWRVTDTVAGSDSTHYIYSDSIYNVLLDTTSTPTTFFLNNFMGNNNYNKIACILDPLNSYDFVFDTARGFRMTYDHMIMISGSGTLSPDKNSIHATFIINYINRTINWQIDTVKMYMTRIN